MRRWRGCHPLVMAICGLEQSRGRALRRTETLRKRASVPVLRPRCSASNPPSRKAKPSRPEKDLHRTTTRRRQPCEIDMRNDEPREDEEEINAEITAGKERQKRIEAGWYILLCVHAQDQ